MNLRDIINNAVDCQREAVPVPEWDCTVYIRSVTAAEIDSWQCETYAVNGSNVEVNRKNIRARLLARCLVDEAGQRAFTDEQAEELGTKNNRVIERLYKIAEKLNAVTAKDVEDLAKNL
ncbi:MAG TPA: hypothetical protein VG269_17460 [Tepidisphaeraceae bacterium]|jgi:hydroxyethylthiazole kinase-like sugar kinase family protein|nr:hypothetical protein [Tepidisphaeraceae bacterium]